MSNNLGFNRCCNENYYKKIIGPQGYQGNAGPIGSMGYQGFQGNKGNQGATGIGCRGPQGYQGTQGNQGFQGASTGITGPQGITGTQGNQGFQGNQGEQGTPAISSASITYYFDTKPGLDKGPGLYGGGVVGTQNIYYQLSGGTGYRDGAVLYPMDVFFNNVSTGNDPFIGPPPSSGGSTLMQQTLCCIAYVAPYNGRVVSVNVNSAFSSSYYNGAEFDFIIMDSASNIVAGQTDWSGGAYATGRQMSGWSTLFNGQNTFKAGDLIYCYVVDTNNDFWNSGGLPFAPDTGIFNITLYLNFN